MGNYARHMRGGAKRADCASGWKSPGGIAAEGREDTALYISASKLLSKGGRLW